MHKIALRNQRRDTTFSCRQAQIIYGYEQRGLNTQLNFLVKGISQWQLKHRLEDHH